MKPVTKRSAQRQRRGIQDLRQDTPTGITALDSDFDPRLGASLQVPFKPTSQPEVPALAVLGEPGQDAEGGRACGAVHTLGQGEVQELVVSGQFPGDQALAQDVWPQGVDAALQGIEGSGQGLDGVSGPLVRVPQGRDSVDSPPCQSRGSGTIGEGEQGQDLFETPLGGLRQPGAVDGLAPIAGLPPQGGVQQACGGLRALPGQGGQGGQMDEEDLSKVLSAQVWGRGRGRTLCGLD